MAKPSRPGPRATLKKRPAEASSKRRTLTGGQLHVLDARVARPVGEGDADAGQVDARQRRQALQTGTAQPRRHLLLELAQFAAGVAALASDEALHVAQVGAEASRRGAHQLDRILLAILARSARHLLTGPTPIKKPKNNNNNKCFHYYDGTSNDKTSVSFLSTASIVSDLFAPSNRGHLKNWLNQWHSRDVDENKMACIKKIEVLLRSLLHRLFLLPSLLARTCKSIR